MSATALFVRPFSNLVAATSQRHRTWKGLLLVAVLFAPTLTTAEEKDPAPLELRLSASTVTAGTAVTLFVHESSSLFSREPERPCHVQIQRFDNASTGRPTAPTDPAGTWMSLGERAILDSSKRELSVPISTSFPPGPYAFRAFGGFADDQKESAVVTLEVTK